MRSPSWIRAARSGTVLGLTKRARGGGRESPYPPPLARFVNPKAGPDLAARIQDGNLITNSVCFYHPTTCEQAKFEITRMFTLWNVWLPHDCELKTWQIGVDNQSWSRTFAIDMINLNVPFTWRTSGFLSVQFLLMLKNPRRASTI